jgi:hypothetical protein
MGSKWEMGTRGRWGAWEMGRKMGVRGRWRGRWEAGGRRAEVGDGDTWEMWSRREKGAEKGRDQELDFCNWVCVMNNMTKITLHANIESRL